MAVAAEQGPIQSPVEAGAEAVVEQTVKVLMANTLEQDQED